MKKRAFYKISFFILLTTFGILVSVLYYGILTYYIQPGTFLGYPFNTAGFVFAFTYAVLIPVVIYFSSNKIKKKLREISKKQMM